MKKMFIIHHAYMGRKLMHIILHFILIIYYIIILHAICYDMI